MAKLRPWLVIPIAGMFGGGVAFVHARQVAFAIAIALCAAALAAAIRAFGGPSLATAMTAAAGALLGVCGVLALGDGATPRAVLGAAAGMFALCELARVQVPVASPWPAIGGAIAAAVLDPSYVALVAITGFHLLGHPRSRPRWAIVVPVLGALALALAVLACIAHGQLAALWIEWSGRAHHATTPLAALGRAGDLLGPLAATTALAGLALATSRGRLPAAAIAGCVALVAVEALGGALPPALPIVAALAAGIALHRFATLIRLPIGQTCVAAAAGFVLVVVPAWTVLM